MEQNMGQWKKLTKQFRDEADGDKRKRQGTTQGNTRDKHDCSYCDRKFVHATGLSKYMSKSHPEKMCTVTKKPNAHKKDQNEPFKVCLKCLKCGMIFGSVEKLMEHLEMVNWEQELEHVDGAYMEEGKLCLWKSIRVVILTTIFQCEFCDKHFSDLSGLYQHESLRDPRLGFECTLCEIKMLSLKDVLYHRLNECVFRESWNDEFKSLSKYFACNVCDEQFESLVALYEHRYGYYHIFPRPSMNLTCSDDHDSSETLKIGCEVCEITFDNADSIFSHYDETHKPKKSTTLGIRCQTAERANSTIPTSPCSSTRPYLCELCGKTYTQSSHLWQHLRFHNGIRPFTCPENGCNRSFTIRPDLKDHIRKCHTGERPYHCTLCDKRFLTGSVYYQHRLIHRGERRYGCDECGKRFYRADALKNHQRIHSGEKPYACPHCQKQFRQRGDREKHIRVKHSKVTTNNLVYEGTPLSSRVGTKKPRKGQKPQHAMEERPSSRQMLEEAPVVYVGDVSLPASLFQPILNDIDML